MSILQHIGKIDRLPTLPNILIQIQTLTSSNQGDAKKLAQILEQDPALAATILKMANSAFYGSPRQRISSIPLAVARIGFNEVRNLAMATSLVQMFPATSNALDHVTFWRHSLQAAYLTNVILGYSNLEPRPEEQAIYFLAGLLHDIGLLIYDQFFHAELDEILKHSTASDLPFLEAEMAIAPKEPHGFVGGAVLEVWKIDSPVIAAVRYHHSPEKAPQIFRRIVLSTFLAEHILCNNGSGSFEGMMLSDIAALWDEAGINADAQDELSHWVESEAARCDWFISQTGDASLKPV